MIQVMGTTVVTLKSDKDDPKTEFVIGPITYFDVAKHVSEYGNEEQAAVAAVLSMVKEVRNVRVGGEVKSFSGEEAAKIASMLPPDQLNELVQIMLTRAGLDMATEKNSRSRRGSRR